MSACVCVRITNHLLNECIARTVIGVRKEFKRIATGMGGLNLYDLTSSTGQRVQFDAIVIDEI